MWTGRFSAEDGGSIFLINIGIYKPTRRYNPEVYSRSVKVTIFGLDKWDLILDRAFGIFIFINTLRTALGPTRLLFKKHRWFFSRE
jgi:hypothetical protein